MRRFIQQAASLCIVLAVVSCSKEKEKETVEKPPQSANGTEQKPGDKPPS
jgi:hypothetical protein